jgi:hypothetical protein
MIRQKNLALATLVGTFLMAFTIIVALLTVLQTPI